MWRVVIATMIVGSVLVVGGETNSTQPLETKKTKEETKIVIGRLENIKIVNIDNSQKARIDTGAKTTSVDAREMEAFERDSKEWIRFKFDDELIEAPVIRTVLIKRHGGKSILRPVVELELKLGKVSRTIEVTLADRSKYAYPILIGRNFLRKTFIVDVSRVFIGCSNKHVKML